MKKVIIFIFMIMCIMLISSDNSEKVLIPKESIRYRIIANSNNVKDQEEKMNIKNELQPLIEQTIRNSNNLEEARLNLKNLVPQISSMLNSKKVDYTVNYGDNYFPEKEYKNVKYEEGNYESLVVTLGDGLGDNWWCVLFPPLCLLEAEESDLNDVEYSFYIKEILNKFY